MRASSMSTRAAAAMVFKVGILFVLVAFVFGELITPRTAPLAERVRLAAKGSTLSAEFRSGMWTKDSIHTDGVKGPVIGTRFFNVRQIRPDGQLVDVRLYEFDPNMRMRALITATGGRYQGNNTWRLTGVSQTLFSNSRELPAPGTPRPEGQSLEASFGQETLAVGTRKLDTLDLASEITPKILSVSRSDPERMSANELAVYTLSDEHRKLAEWPWEAEYPLKKEKTSGWPNTTPEMMFDYATTDTDLTLLIKEVQVQTPAWQSLPADVWETKQKVIRVLTEMRRRGIEVDLELAEQLRDEGEAEKQRIKDELGLNPGSNKDMVELMIHRLGLPILKKSEKTNQPSFAKDVMVEYEPMLERMGVNVREQNLNTKNVATVIVTAKLPAFAASGSQIDVTVSALGDAKSLLGGTLMVTPLIGADGEAYAVGQGTVQTGSISASGASGSSVTKGVPTAGRIAGGATVEREIGFENSSDSYSRSVRRSGVMMRSTRRGVITTPSFRIPADTIAI